MRLDMSSRKAIVENSCREYQQAGKKGRGEILGRLVSAAGMNRDYPAAVPGRTALRRKAEPRGSGAGVRRSTERTS
jgi:hypothetical protein